MAEDSIIPIGIDIITASKEGNPEIVQRLIEAGLDVNDRDTGGYTPLHWACQFRFVEVVRLLLKAGADVNVKNTDRTGYQTPLHLACLFQNAQIVRLLLDAGEDPCARNEGEWTALDYVRKFTLATNPMREEILDLFRQYAPEVVMEAYCSPGPGA